MLQVRTDSSFVIWFVTFISPARRGAWTTADSSYGDRGVRGATAQTDSGFTRLEDQQ
jgi:hypothetical protein